jgi:hypothetical protein
MNKINSSETLEKAHKSNIERLIKEYGAHRHAEISGVYKKIRHADESTAKIRDFVPIFCYRKVKEALSLK